MKHTITSETVPACGTNYAAIDIGSNAVRLLIKHVEEGGDAPEMSKELMVRVPLRLGFDVFARGVISERKEKDMVRVMKAFRQLMKVYDVEEYRACATSAMRDARNGSSIIRRIARKTGIRVEIIDGQEEARIIYNNHLTYMGDRKGNYMYVDVGGGSTEINLLSEGQLVCSRSYNIGTVRILNEAVAESEWTRLKTDLAALAQSYSNINIVGSGGNINKLYRLAEKKDKRVQRMSVATLQALHEALRALPVEERMAKYALKPDRADVIVPAGNIFLLIAGIVSAAYIYVPVIGLSDGIIDENDRYAVGNGNTPPWIFGLQFGFDWKGLDLSLLLQGTAGLEVLWMDRFNMGYLTHGSAINKEIAEGAWRDDRTDATFPRLLTRTNAINNQPSDFWVEDKSYMRLKNIQIGYTLPAKWTQKIDVSRLRIYISGENLFTLTGYRGIDPEVSGTTYPNLRQYVVGVNLSF